MDKKNAQKLADIITAIECRKWYEFRHKRNILKNLPRLLLSILKDEGNINPKQ